MAGAKQIDDFQKMIQFLQSYQDLLKDRDFKEEKIR